MSARSDQTDPIPLARPNDPQVMSTATPMPTGNTPITPSLTPFLRHSSGVQSSVRCGVFRGKDFSSEGAPLACDLIRSSQDAQHPEESEDAGIREPKHPCLRHARGSAANQRPSPSQRHSVFGMTSAQVQPRPRETHFNLGAMHRVILISSMGANQKSWAFSGSFSVRLAVARLWPSSI